MSNEINIEELERLAKAATPGPWKACGTVEQIGGDYKDIIPTSVSCMAYCYGGSADRAEDKDLIFIAAANPSAVISLIDRLKKAEAERDALAAELVELEGQEPVAWLYDWQAPEGLIKGWVETNRDAIPEDATNIRPLYARPAPAEPVNARLLEALKLAECVYRKNVVNEGEPSSVLEAMQAAITAAEAQRPGEVSDCRSHRESRPAIAHDADC